MREISSSGLADSDTSRRFRTFLRDACIYTKSPYSMNDLLSNLRSSHTAVVVVGSISSTPFMVFSVTCIYSVTYPNLRCMLGYTDD
jgi:hypothetical protein